jgi:NO-binding membrane sensor protein with MHYT domain
MGLAVTGMHYTGIAAMRVTIMPSMPVVNGISASVLIPMLIMAVSVVSVLTVFIIALSPGAQELRQDAELREWVAQQSR